MEESWKAAMYSLPCNVSQSARSLAAGLWFIAGGMSSVPELRITYGLGFRVEGFEGLGLRV